MDVIMDVIMDAYVIMGLRDTLFAIITFVIMAYNGVIMETRFASADSDGEHFILHSEATQHFQ